MTDAAAKNTATTDGANNGGTEKADTEKRGRNGGKEKDVQGKRGRNKNRPRDDRPAQKDTLCPHVSEGRACNFGERWVGWGGLRPIARHVRRANTFFAKSVSVFVAWPDVPCTGRDAGASVLRSTRLLVYDAEWGPSSKRRA